jgi:hypothetical protein
MTFDSHPSHGGVFTAGSRADKTVNIKTYSRHESVLDVSRAEAVFACFVLVRALWSVHRRRAVRIFCRPHLLVCPSGRPCCLADDITPLDAEVAIVLGGVAD